MVDWTSEPHIWPCSLFYSSSWTGGGYSGKPLERNPGNRCTCAVDNADLPVDPLPYVHDCWDDGTCLENGQRRDKKGINDIFSPRDGYSKNEMDYS